uniref:Protein tyrosine phosphatase non-receptor type 20 n=1 Tax=Molossus molossus TaxID=27622 RepID=A0A7J8DQU0_MOLMO|nr:protein tyrosine phosphatase non-receptor type 20 [Molossus molossus]
MSLPRKASEPGTEKEEEDSDTTDWNSWKTLPSSSQGKTPRTVFANEVNLEKVKLYRQDFQHIDSEDLLKGATESGSEPSMRTASGAVLRDKWSSESELAGPSQTPGLHGVHIVSERELAQLTQVRPLVFGFHEQSAIKDCVKILQKKVEEHEIIQEFMFNIKNIVAQMREQRCGMVQTKEQYCFCYTVVLAVLQKLVTLD